MQNKLLTILIQKIFDVPRPKGVLAFDINIDKFFCSEHSNIGTEHI
jgi:hypothetical protein